jgi:hypothetical protein
MISFERCAESLIVFTNAIAKFGRGFVIRTQRRRLSEDPNHLQDLERERQLKGK